MELFSENTALALCLITFLGGISMAMLHDLACDLLKMHKSKTAVKKLCGAYFLIQRLFLRPAWEHCEHAVKFCRAVILLYGLQAAATASVVALGIAALLWGKLCCLFGYTAAAKVLFLDAPVLLLSVVLFKRPTNKERGKWRFEKYHNTSNHESLF